MELGDMEWASRTSIVTTKHIVVHGYSRYESVLGKEREVGVAVTVRGTTVRNQINQIRV